MYVFKRFSLKNKNCVHSPHFLFINYRSVNTTAHYKYTLQSESNPIKITPTIYTLQNRLSWLFPYWLRVQDCLLLETFKIDHRHKILARFLPYDSPSSCTFTKHVEKLYKHHENANFYMTVQPPGWAIAFRRASSTQSRGFNVTGSNTLPTFLLCLCTADRKAGKSNSGCG